MIRLCVHRARFETAPGAWFAAPESLSSSPKSASRGLPSRRCSRGRILAGPLQRDGWALPGCPAGAQFLALQGCSPCRTARFRRLRGPEALHRACFRRPLRALQGLRASRQALRARGCTGPGRPSGSLRRASAGRRGCRGRRTWPLRPGLFPRGPCRPPGRPRRKRGPRRRTRLTGSRTSRRVRRPPSPGRSLGPRLRAGPAGAHDSHARRPEAPLIPQTNCRGRLLLQQENGRHNLGQARVPQGTSSPLCCPPCRVCVVASCPITERTALPGCPAAAGDRRGDLVRSHAPLPTRERSRCRRSPCP